MEQNYGTPIPPIEEFAPPPKKKSNLVLIIVIVLLVLCCCCVVLSGAGYWLWNYGDQLLGITSTLPTALLSI